MKNIHRGKNLSISSKTILSIPTDEFRSLPIPQGSAKVGTCFVRVTDLPSALDDFMGVNPRVPDRNKNGTLSGAVIKGILKTLRENPEDMALKNQGIYILTEDIDFKKLTGGEGRVSVVLSDKTKHGIVNGGHTYAAIRSIMDDADDDEREALKNAYVRLHLFQGIDEDMVSQIAEGLNRSKQVDDPSLENLKGTFDAIKDAMRKNPAADSIAYRQGDDGEIDISEILTYLAFFNCERFSEKKHPHQFYKRPSTALKFFSDDKDSSTSPIPVLIKSLPDILWLVDSIRLTTPNAAQDINFEIGRMKIGKDRSGSKKNKGIKLPFIDKTIDYRIPNGWVYPMLAAFRANIEWDSKQNNLKWKVPLKIILPDVIEDLVSICVTELKDNNMRPEMIGSRESIYRQCYDKVQLYLAKKRLL